MMVAALGPHTGGGVCLQARFSDGVGGGIGGGEAVGQTPAELNPL